MFTNQRTSCDANLRFSKQIKRIKQQLGPFTKALHTQEASCTRQRSLRNQTLVCRSCSLQDGYTCGEQESALALRVFVSGSTFYSRIVRERKGEGAIGGVGMGGGQVG